MTESDRYRGVFKNALDGIALHEIITDDEGTPIDYVFLEVNPSFERILSVSAEDVVGRRVTEVFPGIEHEVWIRIYGRVVATGEVADFEQHSEALDKHFKVHAYRSAPGQFVTVFHDITDYIVARDALEHSEALRRSMIESSTDHIMRVDLDGTIEAINRTVDGLATEEVVGSRLHDHLDEQWHASVNECFERVVQTGKPDRYEVQYDFADGHVGYFESRVGPVLRDGEVVALTVSATDRTQQYELEERLRQSQ
jgi:PAS domain S-box-containing protein